MATPIGHSLAGLTALATAPRCRVMPMLLVAIVMANAADLDFLPGLFVGMPALYHHGITHSLGCAGIASLAAALVLRRFGAPFGVAFRIAFIAYASHLALDFVGPDIRPPFGIPIFWPLSDRHFISPVAILPGVLHAPRTDASILDWLHGMLAVRNVGAMVIETALFAPLAWLAHRRVAFDRAVKG